MTHCVSKIPVPNSSKISQLLANAYFHDAYQLELANSERSALGLFLDMASNTPRWINILMLIRNKIVSLFGLKDIGLFNHLDQGKVESEYQIGDRVGIFSICYISEEEVIVGDSDRHLNVRVSIYKLRDGKHSVAISTVVHTHNLAGKIYMFFVTPAHKIIAPSMAKLIVPG